ncbi:hypothetical protein QUF80_02295 [Desulfococcaceae bacterium HSG8]|nr:hypothetical protein [Desulfococcaceae bacterium HSG8]
MLIKKITVILFLLAMSELSIAGPDQTTSYLMNESVSLLDFGLYRLEEYFDTIYQKDLYITRVNYDWDDNKIIIVVRNTDSGSFGSAREAKEWCRSIICEIKGKLGIDCSTGKPLTLKKNSPLQRFFSHKSYKSKNEPEGLKSEIEMMIKVTVSTYWGRNGRFLRCEVPLLGKKILCSE